ncbi:hypothetical protein [Rothia aerolata]|uniref:DUF2178 domain-containing protein n=1 Tax=Rothia aerolata TaxID=1812262 RepID=A0A917MR31_9MICC|nr:hypothetical protein [Rothia aerolata]GGH59262.1 hypothetical protein GCM10007359_06310 [Rothia aerolata]
MHNTQERSTFGRAKFGGSSTLLITISLVSGALLALLFAFGIYLVQDSKLPWWGILLAALPLYPVTAATIWAIFVDRNTIKGAVKNPENSIENSWFSKAAESSFCIIVAVLGIGAGVTAIFDLEFQTDMVLTAATMLCFIVFFVCYQFHKRTGR